MRLDLFFDVNGQRPFVSAKMRRRALDTALEGEGDRTIALPSGDKCIIVTNLSEVDVVTSLLVPLLTEDGLPILTEDGEFILVEDGGGEALFIEAGGFIILPGRAQHGALSVAVPAVGQVRVTVLQ